MDRLSSQLINIVSEITGIDSQEIELDHHIYLDLNTSPAEIQEIKEQLEYEFNIELDDHQFSEMTINELITIVEDAIL